LDGTLLCSEISGAKNNKTFNPPLDQDVPFALESHIHCESLNARSPKGFNPVLKPYLKTASKHFFKGSSP
jgi:hypothetical protein